MGTLQRPTQSVQTKEEIGLLVSVRDAYKKHNDEIFDMLISSGALLKGHFCLESGQHSGFLLRFTNIVGSRRYVERIADLLIAELKNDRVGINAILVQEAAGRVLGETIADKLDARKVVVETDDRNRPIKHLINETTLYPGDRVLVVSDLTTTASGLKDMTTLVRKKKATPIAIALFATRNKEEVHKFERQEHLKVYALADLAFEEKTYGKPGSEATEADCELCRQTRCLVPSWET